MEAEPEGEFLASEQIGVMIPKTCGKCKTCLQCVIQEDGPSVKEHLELDMMRKGMVHDPVNKRMVVSYPMAPSPKSNKREEREKRALGCFGCQGSWHFKASKASLSVRKAFLIKIREQNCMFEATQKIKLQY